MNVHNQTVLITGATGGLGQAIAQALSQAGARLILTGRNEITLQQMQNKLGRQHQIVSADVSTAQGREKIARVCEEVIKLDTVIHCAGTNHCGWFESASPEKIEQLIHLNLTSTMLLTHQLLPVLLKQTRTQVIMIGSILGSIGLPGYSAYCASKFGLHGFCESLRRELRHTGVRVRYFAPRAINTDINCPQVKALNNELDNAVDQPEIVAEALVKFMAKSQTEYFYGWPEKLFVKLNGLVSQIVDQAIHKQFHIYRKYLSNGGH